MEAYRLHNEQENVLKIPHSPLLPANGLLIIISSL